MTQAADSPRVRKTRTPMMVTSSAEEIAAWNEKVKPHNTKRRLHRAPRSSWSLGQRQKFANRVAA